MPNTIILMTALVPTIGHKYLIDFATSLLDWGDKAHVIVGTLDREPVPGYLRVAALKEAYRNREEVVIHHLYRDVPQEPNEHPDFWGVWRDIVREFVNVKPSDYFVASELYGMNMAEILGCRFMPCNRYREILPVSGTAVRKNLFDNFDFILPQFQKHIRKTITIFGAESCGKTTMAKHLAAELNGYFVPEWAREYLETVGPEVTDEKMRIIVAGQEASQYTAKATLLDKPLIIQDTDLFSTLGYYRLWKGGTYQDIRDVTQRAKNLASDLYIVMNDKIPFEPDPLRYGGDKRESNSQYWVELLEEFKLPYYEVQSTDRYKQRMEVGLAVLNMFDASHKAISKYNR